VVACDRRHLNFLYVRGELRPQNQRLSESVLGFFSKNMDPQNLTVALNLTVAFLDAITRERTWRTT
jgi:hypothetical protein